MSEPKEVWITGIGIVSSLGEGLDAHWDALNARRINVDEKRFAPYVVHPLAAISVRWKLGSASAPMPPAWRWTAPASKATRKSSAAWI
jgi:3-oxoacyl-(acyl-carrier-protein) synthase